MVYILSCTKIAYLFWALSSFTFPQFFPRISTVARKIFINLNSFVFPLFASARIRSFVLKPLNFATIFLQVDHFLPPTQWALSILRFGSLIFSEFLPAEGHFMTLLYLVSLNNLSSNCFFA